MNIPSHTKIEMQLTNDIKKNILNFLEFHQNEKIELLYSYYSTYSIKNDIMVGITNKRIFKIDKGVKRFTNMNSIKTAKHIKKWLFFWDKIECMTTDEKIETYGIFHALDCNYFCNYLNDNFININTNIGSNINENINTNIEPNVDENINTTIESDINENINTAIESDINENINTNIESNVDININTAIKSNVDENINTSIESDINENINTNVKYNIEYNINEHIDASSKFNMDIDKNINVKNNTTIYILKLQADKYYVGKTTDKIKRILEHVNGLGSVWTSIYPVVEIYKTYENCSDFDEDKYTLEMMSEFGIENVRGGSYVQKVLDSSTLAHIKKCINSATNKCVSCGEKGHFIKNCSNQNKINKNVKDIIMNKSIKQIVIEKHTIEQNNVGAKWTIQEEKKMWTYISENKTSEEIGKLLKRNVGGINSRINKIVIEMRKKGKTTEEINKITNLDNQKINFIIMNTSKKFKKYTQNNSTGKKENNELTKLEMEFNKIGK